MKSALGLNPSSQIHYTDHLAVICIIMGIPLLFLDELDYELGMKYYPGLEAFKQEYAGFNPEYLIKNYDVLFLSDLWDRQTFHEKFLPLEKKYHKVLRHVHVPHGFSDKVFYMKKTANEDIALIYGQNMIDLMKEGEAYDNLNQYVITGNYRYTYFKQHRPFYDKIVQEEILSQFAKKQPIILYAPTWLDLEESTTFFDAYQEIMENLPSEFNMIVKLHPRLELDDTPNYYHIVGKYQKKPNILFLKDYPLVYPLLAHSDLYLGDMSSVGYDYLPFNRPMFFLNKLKKDVQFDRGTYLFRCGVPILPEKYGQLYDIIEKNRENDSERFGQIRKEVYDYTFGPERSFSDLKKEIEEAYADDYYASLKKRN